MSATLKTWEQQVLSYKFMPIVDELCAWEWKLQLTRLRPCRVTRLASTNQRLLAVLTSHFISQIQRICLTAVLTIARLFPIGCIVLKCAICYRAQIGLFGSLQSFDFIGLVWKQPLGKRRVPFHTVAWKHANMLLFSLTTCLTDLYSTITI